MNWIKSISQTIFGDKNFARFKSEEFLWLFLILILIIVLLIVSRKIHQNKIAKIIQPELQKLVIPNQSKTRWAVRLVLWTIGMTAIILGMANLQFGESKEEIKKEGIDIVMCLDVSNSMLAEDIQPNRLTRAKLAINNIINQLGSDRIALVVFAGNAYLQLPLTSDHSAAKLYLDNVNPGMIPVPGTSIAAALEKSIEAFPPNSTTNKAIIVITDGENHEEEAIETAEKAAEKGIQIFTLGLGETTGSPIPDIRNGKRIGLKKDKNGSTIITRLNESLLIDIAKAGNGSYIRGSNQSLGLDYLFNEVSKIEKTEIETTEFTSYKDQFQLFLLIGLILIVLEFIMFTGKGKWFRSKI